MSDRHIDPERAQFDAFKALPRDTPIHMLNLVRFKDRATYPDDHPLAGKALTTDDYQRAAHIVPMPYSISQRGVIDTYGQQNYRQSHARHRHKTA